MEASPPMIGPAMGSPAEPQRKAYYSRLFRRFVLLTMVCSLVPLLMVGWAINIHYTRFAENRMIESFHNQLEHHRKIIELFLKERTSKLDVIAQAGTCEQLTDPARLHDVFQSLNRNDNSFTDLGIIDASGNHLAYIGPYDLLDKNYADTFWFKEVMDKGIFISDMFMGFRQVPHFIIAVVREEKGKKWILRATIDTEVFRSLVERARVGLSGEVLLLNREGVFQTSPKFSGKIMQKAPFPVEAPGTGIRIETHQEVRDQGNRVLPRQIIAKTWLQEPRWLLMIRQDYAEALNEVNHANYVTLIFLHISALIILAVTVLVTRHMISVIKRRDMEADQLNRQYLQASKLASIGELSAGVAHEINNPLAIILTERQILMDMAGRTLEMDPEFKAQFFDSMSQIDIQVQRCKRITQNLLRFSRRTQSMLETIDLNAFLGEVVELMEREAKSNGIKFITELESGLPDIKSDPSQLQQVFLNLITNAMDAHDEKPYGAIRIKTGSEDHGTRIKIVFADTGSGIEAGILENIFDPFFTTKPVGRGTGLGLSICYSIVQRLGGDISVKSEPGKGTEFTLILPVEPPKELKEEIADGC